MRWSRDAFPPRGRFPFIWRGLISFWRGRRDRLLKEYPEAQAGTGLYGKPLWCLS